MENINQKLASISQLIASHSSFAGSLPGAGESLCDAKFAQSVSSLTATATGPGEKGYWAVYAIQALNSRDTDDFGTRLETLNWHLKMRTFVTGHTLSADDVQLFVAFTLCPHWLPIYGTNRRLSIKYICRWYKYLEMLDAFRSAKDSYAQTGDYEQAVVMEELQGENLMGRVVTRFPPEPSGYLHIGHGKACLLNQYYAKRYQGKIILRFDDTNPKKSRQEYHDNILKDVQSLGVEFDQRTYTSDNFGMLIEYAERMINAGLAFVETANGETISKMRELLEPSTCRDDPVEATLAKWEEMKAGTELGKTYCLRAKIDYLHLNGTMRDPVIYRCVDGVHYRTGTQFKVYPIYNFACPIIDAVEGVTHALRSNEYHSSEEQFYWFLANIPGLPRRDVLIKDFSRISFAYTVMSKRKLQWFVDERIVDDWTDPRFPTIQGMMRRGLTMEALKRFILSQGDSKKGVNMDINIMWAINKQIIDREIPRYTCIRSEHIVPIVIRGMPVETETVQAWKCKNNEELGKKPVTRANRIYIDQEDAVKIVLNEEVTLMEWGNAIVRVINRDEQGVVTSMEADLNLAGDFKLTKKKLTWLPAVDSHPLVQCTIVEYDTLVCAKDIPKESNFKEFVTPCSKFTTQALTDSSIRDLKHGDKLQFERLGYFSVDAASSDNYVFIQFPDGHDTNKFLSCKVAVRK